MYSKTLYAKKQRHWHTPRVWLMALLACVLLSPAAHAQLSGTKTVCASGCDYSTVYAAVSAIKSNGISGPLTIDIKAGSYNLDSSVTLERIPGSSATNTVTFKGAGQASTRLYGKAANYANGGVFQLRGVSNVIVKNMTIENTTVTNSRNTLVVNTCTDIVVEDCAIIAPVTSSTMYTVYHYYNSRNRFSRNLMTGGYRTVYNYGASSLAYGFTTFEYNTVRNAYLNSFYNYYNDRNIYRYNVLDSISATSTSVTYGIMSYYENGSVYDGNIIAGYNMTGAAMYMNYMNTYADQNTFRMVNNIVGPCKMPSGRTLSRAVYYNPATTKGNSEFSNNTVHVDGTDGENFYFTNNYAFSHIIRGNIFTRSTTGVLANYAGPNAAYVIDNNNYYNTGGTLVSYAGTAYTTLADFKNAATALGHAKNESNVTIPYKSSSDYHIAANSTLPATRNSGTSTDVDGNTRCTGWTAIGADEAKIASPTKPGLDIADSAYINVATAIKGIKLYPYADFTISINGNKVKDSSGYIFTPSATGTYTIRLTAANCSGSEYAEKTIKIISPSKVPSTRFLAATSNVIVPDGTVKFVDFSDNGASTWNWTVTPDAVLENGAMQPIISFVNGTTANSKNPEIKFERAGKYTICLTTANLNGTGNTVCKQDYVFVNSVYNMGSQSVVQDSTGTLYDEGGPNANYSTNNAKQTLLISPCPSAAKVYVIVKSFDTECGRDFLRLFDGRNNTAKAMHPCTTNLNGTYGPGFTGRSNGTTCATLCRPAVTDTFVATSGNVFVEWSTDISVNAAGFELYWYSEPQANTSKPVASFTGPDTVFTNSVASFKNTTSADVNEFYWDFDGDLGGFEDEKRDGSYGYLSAGTYTARLIAVNCYGTDTAMKTILVVDPSKPKATFEVDNSTPSVGETIRFTNTTAGHIDGYSWRIVNSNGSAAKVTYLNGTSTSSKNPAVSLSDTGCYTVVLKAVNAGGTDSVVKPCYIYVKGAYCQPIVDNMISDLGISRVRFNTIDNTSSQAVNGYTDFTSANNTTVEIGATYTLTVDRNTSANNISRAVWIDWNGDADFNDVNELVALSASGSGKTWTADIKIPAGLARVGATSMRIGVNGENEVMNSCDKNAFGEYEDYKLYIKTDFRAPAVKLNGAATMTIESQFTFNDPGATARDSVDGDLTSKIVRTSKPAFNPLIPGTYVLTYAATDARGNKGTADRTVIVTPDMGAPKLEVAGNDTTIIKLGEAFANPAVILAYDAAEGDLKDEVTITGSVNNAVVGTYTLVYEVKDLSFNKTTVKRTVIVIDDIAPVVMLKGQASVNVEVKSAYTDAGVTITDNYYSETELQKLVIKTSNVNTAVTGTYTVTYTVTDPSGNASGVVTRTVKVVDTQKPVISLKGSSNMQLEVGTKYTELGINIADNYSVITRYDSAGTFYQNFPNGRPNKLGTYTIIYTVQDDAGNSEVATRTIETVDRTAPAISLEGEPNVNICRWATYADAKYRISDNLDDSASIIVTTEGSFKQNQALKEGIYSLRYKAVDKSGNVSYSEWRTINVMSPEQCGTSAIGDNSNLSKQISVFPNPSQGKFQVRMNGAANDRVRISVMNLLGAEVAVAGSNLSGEGTYSIDLSTQAPGVYLLQVTNGKETAIQRVVISR